MATTLPLPSPSTRPRRRRRGPASFLRWLLVLALLAGSAWVAFRVLDFVDSFTPSRGAPVSTRIPIDPADVEPRSAVPAGPVAVPPGPGEEAAPPAAPPEVAERSDPSESAAPPPPPVTVEEWADRMSTVLDVPARALRAYAAAEVRMRADMPACGVRWSTVAAIGRIESDHGQIGGRTLEEDGLSSEPIYGVPLDGRPGIREMIDEDASAEAGETVYVRAEGPMQFLPSTWDIWGADGNGDGVADPQHIDDAALGTARYLCSAGANLDDATDWWDAVFAYNNSVDYGQRIFGLAERYATIEVPAP
ncbi:murein transglycosylase [Actinoalloteichus sp. AHMU CJ021]|uniref:lytic transglycosylase domain-containing protein n=1 Tax=Actinoalloteichus TaxID=65496 RepID=UPI0004793F25|nr:lytic transglycosylase domain-containing protein [Actinoalloteichus caeruleus]AUS78324.1 murein transglycosylase [Actinoalloteichus sp. AHMU CJ021]